MLDVILLRFKQRGGVVVDGDRGDLVALLDRIHHVLAIGHLAEDRVFAIEMRSRAVGDEELRAIGPRTGIGHREHTG